MDPLCRWSMRRPVVLSSAIAIGVTLHPCGVVDAHPRKAPVEAHEGGTHKGETPAGVDSGAAVTTARPNEAKPPDVSSLPLKLEPEGRVSQPWAIAGSIIPGLLVHGSGSWLSGDDDTSKRLLILQGTGIGVTGGSLAALALTGAARDWVGLFATTTVFGVGALGVSFLADVYRTALPKGMGRHPGHIPWGTTEVGLLWVNGPHVDLGPVVNVSATLHSGRWITAAQTAHSPWSLHAAARLESGYRLLGAAENEPNETAGGGHASLFFGLTGERYGEEGFSSSGSEVRLEARIDSEHLAPHVRGAFVEWELGYAARRTSFPLTRRYHDDSLLIAGVAFGAYHGDATRRGGATRLYYNHRHDGYAGGLVTTGIGSGVAGRVGFDSRHFFSPRWGFRIGAEVGSAWVFGIHLITQFWEEVPLLNALSPSPPDEPSSSIPKVP